MTVVNAVEVVTTSNKKPNNGETLIHIVLDETSSMNSCRQATISSFNEYIESQKGLDGVCRVSMTMFSQQAYRGGYSMLAVMPREEDLKKVDVRDLYSNLPIADVELLNSSNYKPNGNTNLYDAIGVTIHKIESQLATMSSVPNVLVVIITDGEENCSREFNLTSLKPLMKDKETEGWTFIYLGANQDAWKVGANMGLSKGQTMTYDTNRMYDATASLGASTATYRAMRGVGKSANGEVDRNFFGDEE